MSISKLTTACTLAIALLSFSNTALARFISEDPKGFEAGVNFYAYANNNPANANDPSGELALLGGRPLDGTPVNSLSPHHTVIVLMPDDPSSFTNRTGWNALSNGGIISTLSGQPSAGASWATFTGQSKLVYTPNWSSDQIQNLTQLQRIPTPNGMTDTQHINALINAAGNYNNSAQYVLTPVEFGGHNSNSFTSGVISNAGGTPPLINYAAPGYSKPLPINSGATGTWGSGALGSWGSSSAAGGFLLYPNKANTNQLQSVYSK